MLLLSDTSSLVICLAAATHGTNKNFTDKCIIPRENQFLSKFINMKVVSKKKLQQIDKIIAHLHKISNYCDNNVELKAWYKQSRTNKLINNAIKSLPIKQ